MAHKRAWRFTVLALLLIALIGPWAYDKINVPAQYSCSTSVRLEGDFCGIPLTGGRIFTFAVGALVGSVGRLIVSEGGIGPEIRNIRAGILILIIFLPLLSLLIMTIRNDGRRFRTSHMLILGAAIGVCAFIASSGFSRHYWALWGIWSYFGLLLTVLVLELLNYRQARRMKLAD